MGHDGQQANRSVVLSVGKQSFLLDMDQSRNLRGAGCYVSPSFLGVVDEQELDQNLKETTA